MPIAVGTILLMSVAGQAQQKPLAAASSAAPLVRGVRIQTPPTIDGNIDENGEWKEAQSFEGLVDQSTGAQCPETARFWLAYDSKFVYFAARMGDSQPNAIRAVEYRSNTALTLNQSNNAYSLSGDDVIQLSIDPSGSMSNFSTFVVNPKGASGLTIAGGRAAKSEWLGEFSARARITNTG